jgi:hypothetical protein
MLKNEVAPIRHRPSRNFDQVIAAPSIPSSDACVHRNNVFERVVALRVRRIDFLPGRKDERLGKVHVLRQKTPKGIVRDDSQLMQRPERVQNAAIKEDRPSRTGVTPILRLLALEDLFRELAQRWSRTETLA